MFFDNRDLKNNIKKLEEENGKLQNTVQEQQMCIQHLQAANQLYEEQYINTELECESCHTSLQKNFYWCPRCGKKIVKQVKPAAPNEKIFMTEDDGYECIIVGYQGFHDKEITIPAYINGKKVIGIWNKAFYCCKEIEKVVFEDGCQFIGHQAFRVCTALKEIIFPKTLREIGNEAFNCTNLSEVIIPANVASIGAGAFKQCDHLKRVILPEKLEYIADELLAKSPVEELILPERLTAIGSVW